MVPPSTELLPSAAPSSVHHFVATLPGDPCGAPVGAAGQPRAAGRAGGAALEDGGTAGTGRGRGAGEPELGARARGDGA